MAGETVITLVGNLTGDPELRYTPQGAAVANFTIASTPRTYDRASGEWKDGEALFLRASVWREMAENVANSLSKGTRVVASGRLRSRSYETREGERRTSMELEIEDIGPSLRFASAQVTRNPSRGSGGFGGDNNPAASSFGAQAGGQTAPAADPWAEPGGASNAAGWGAPVDDEPPF